jgi:hypothetical protein
MIEIEMIFYWKEMISSLKTSAKNWAVWWVKIQHQQSQIEEKCEWNGATRVYQKFTVGPNGRWTLDAAKEDMESSERKTKVLQECCYKKTKCNRANDVAIVVSWLKTISKISECAIEAQNEMYQKKQNNDEINKRTSSIVDSNDAFKNHLTELWRK